MLMQQVVVGDIILGEMLYSMKRFLMAGHSTQTVLTLGSLPSPSHNFRMCFNFMIVDGYPVQQVPWRASYSTGKLPGSDSARYHRQRAHSYEAMEGYRRAGQSISVLSLQNTNLGSGKR